MGDVSVPSLHLVCESLEGLGEISTSIQEFAGDLKVWLMRGELGAGKTTLIKTICSNMGVGDEVNSPSFAIINEYLNGNGEPLYHFDFYRIEDEKEAFDVGTEEYFYSGSLCFVEWPEKIPGLVPDRYLEVQIEAEETGKRRYTICRYD